MRAIAYLRTSSAANVEGDSATRQARAIDSYAASAGLDLVACYWDAAVSGADAIEDRAGFRALLDYAATEGIAVVVVEGADRFARSQIASELGIVTLRARGVRLVTASGQDLTDDSDPARVMLRQVAASFAEYEKRRLVEKLRGARQRIRAREGKCEGAKGYREKAPDLVARARALRAEAGRTLRDVAAILAAEGHVTASGRPFGPGQVARLVKVPA